MSQRLRIFFTTSCLNTSMMALHAGQTKDQRYTDILVIDRIPVRSSTAKTIRQAAELHDFKRVVDLSLDKSDETGLQGSASKRLTRKLKSKPVFKQVYDALYGRLLNKQKTEWALLLQEEIPELNEQYDELLILSQPMIRLLPSARALFPNAAVHFFEHGLGDNLDILGKMGPKDRFLALFGQELSTEQTMPLELDLGAHAEGIKRAFPKAEAAFEGLPEGRPWVLFATQPLEGFGVPNSYWDHFISLCAAHISKDALVLIKPHPSQDMAVCDHIKTVFDSRGIDSVIWDNASAKFLNLEILYALRQDSIASVFSPFSSSVFYLSKLFPDQEPRFYYSMKSLDGFTQNTPEPIRERWTELVRLIEDVFAANATDIS